MNFIILVCIGWIWHFISSKKKNKNVNNQLSHYLLSRHISVSLVYPLLTRSVDLVNVFKPTHYRIAPCTSNIYALQGVCSLLLGMQSGWAQVGMVSHEGILDERKGRMFQFSWRWGILAEWKDHDIQGQTDLGLNPESAPCWLRPWASLLSYLGLTFLIGNRKYITTLLRGLLSILNIYI